MSQQYGFLRGQGLASTAVGVFPTCRTAATYPLRPGEHDGNEPEILAAVLDELILELRGGKRKK